MGDAATNVVTEIQQEAMEVDGDSVEKAEDSTLNDSGNVLSVNGEESTEQSTEQSTPKFGTYQVKVVGLPKYYSIGEFKRMVKVDLGLALSYVRAPKKGTPLLHLAFYTSEEQHKAVNVLHNLSWKKKVLNCSLLPTDAQKRKPEDSDGEDSEAKKARLDLTVEERVQKLTIPYHNMPYEEQHRECIFQRAGDMEHHTQLAVEINTTSALANYATELKKKTGELKEMMVRLGELLVRRNPAIAGYMEQQKEKHDGLPIQLDEIKPSPVIEAYRNKCEFRVGLNPDTQERTVGVRLESYKDFTIGVGPATSLIHLPEQMREAVKSAATVISYDYWPHIVHHFCNQPPITFITLIISLTSSSSYGVVHGSQFANRPVSRLTLSSHIMSKTDATPEALIGQESAPKPPPPLKDHTCKQQLFEEYVRKSHYGPFLPEKSEGYWRHLVVRVTGNGDLMLVIVIHPQSLSEDELTKIKYDLKDYFTNKQGKLCNVSSLYFQLFSEKLVGVPLPQMEHLYGKTHLTEELFDLTIHLSPSSYFQVNTHGAEVLYQTVIDMVEPTEDTTVLDLCCGTGGISLCIAKKCAKVYGIEYMAHNVEDAKLNAAKNEITNCEFISGRVEDILPTLTDKLTGKNVIPILDPPRAGLTSKVLGQLRKMENVQKMVYICSNHKSPIRNFLDLCFPAGKGNNNFSGHPFIPVKVVPVDVAPFSMHAQMVILLERMDTSKLPKESVDTFRGLGWGRGRGRGRGIRGRGIRGHGARLRGGVPVQMPRGRGGRGRHIGIPIGRGPLPPPPPQRLGYMRPPPPPPMGPPLLREYSRPLMRPRVRDIYMDEYSEYNVPLMEREYLPPVLDPYPPPRRPQRLDFSSDELTLSRYSDFRRDVEDAIDSSFSPRSLGLRRSMGGIGRADELLMGSPAATAAAMLEREELAYRAGLTRGLVGAATFAPPPNVYPYSGGGGMRVGRYKGAGGGSLPRGLKRDTASSWGRRGRGGRR
uniref:tRNA (uracil(54)-C(5))-methyltransferase n=1 Tax=Timema douglasi TaxID=61478 RepID=A0A7R8VDB6_TIMDO|nr:unnamed protein product [Timema douglasi]